MHEPALTLAAYPGRVALMDPNGNMQLAQYDPSYFTEQDYINDILLNGNGRPGYTFLAISPTEVCVIVNKANSGFMCNDAVTITVGSAYTGMITIDCNPIISYHEETICGFSTEIGTDYRYAFNGKEHDPEWNGDGAMYDYGFRIYDSRLGKFLSVDPLTTGYPWFSPYHFAGNIPTWCNDLDGLEPNYTTINPEAGFTFRLNNGNRLSVGVFVGATARNALHTVAFEGGARVDIQYGNIYGNGQNIFRNTFSAFGGLGGGSGTGSQYLSFSPYGFAGSGISSGGWAAGYMHSYVAGSHLNGYNINSSLGTFYYRVAGNNSSFLASHGNDWFGTALEHGLGLRDVETDWNLTATGLFAYQQFSFGSPNFIMAAYAFELFTPPALLKSGRSGMERVTQPAANGGEEYVLDDASHHVFSQSQTATTSTNQSHQSRISYEGGIQEFWQNRLAHGNGFRFPIFNGQNPNYQSQEKKPYEPEKTSPRIRVH